MKKLCTLSSLGIFCLLFCLFSCENENFPLEPIEIRVENIGNFDFDLVRINTGGGEQVFTSVKAGQKTSYQAFSYGFNYVAILIEANGERFGKQPIDYVGEKPLKKGKYTYQLALLGVNKGASFTSQLKQD